MGKIKLNKNRIKDLLSPKQPSVVKYFKIEGITKPLKIRVKTDIIQNIGQNTSQSCAQSTHCLSLDKKDYDVSICSLIRNNNDNSFFLLSVGHILRDLNDPLKKKNKNGLIHHSERPKVYCGGVNTEFVEIGCIYYQILTNSIDLSLIKLERNTTNKNIYLTLINELLSFKKTAIINRNNIGDKVHVMSYVTKKRSAYILGIDAPSTCFKSNIIIGTTNNTDTSKPVSENGDSGGCVYIEDSNKRTLIGMIVGHNEKFSYVLPVNDINIHLNHIEGHNFSIR